jgi:hypothetical protein
MGRQTKRALKPSADVKPSASAGPYRMLEQILRRSIGWADGIVSPFALKRNRRAVRVRRRAA